ncbi:MAG TPA: hypothetical protein ENK14_00175 [Caldithrix sp.]|nr:hypothetical protein [Caldithrix sp.]
MKNFYHRVLSGGIIYATFLLMVVFINSSPAGVGDKLPVVTAEAIAPPDPLFDRVVARGIELTFNDRYEESLALFDSLVQAYPNHPAPYFFRSATYQNWMSSYRFNKFQKEVEENVQTVIDLAGKMLKEKDDPWLHFYIGAAYGYRGFNRFRKHNWLGAYKDAKRGVGNFEKALLADSTLYDVYLGLGSYYYWRTAKSKFLRLITFWMRDKRELGLKQLRFAIEHGRYAPNEASYVLLMALFNEKKYADAEVILEEILSRKKTSSLSDYYFRGRLVAQSGNWPEVETAFRTILNKIENYKFTSIGYQVECKYWIARAVSEQGHKAQALQIAREAQLQSKQRNKEEEIESIIENFGQIKKNLEKLIKELKKANRKSVGS